MIYQDLTVEQKLTRLIDIEEIKKVAHTRVYYLVNEWREKELEDLWTKERRDSATFGSNTGFYVGMDSIKKWYTNRGDRSVSCMKHQPACTDLVEVAKDGQTARAMFYTIGEETTDNNALWISGKIVMDLVKEDGKWKIWHLIESNDVNCAPGEAFSAKDPYWIKEEDPIVQAFGTPDIEVLTHDPNFNWWDDYPAMPDPYDTWNDKQSYAPEGFTAPALKGLNIKEGGNY